MKLALAQVDAAVGDLRGNSEKILAALPKIKHAGVLGVTQFDEKGDTLNHAITFFQVQNGKFQPLK